MNTLPASIEESLKDAGFSQTEILIMRRLIEDRSLSLRQLAAKTGKSTGVLDQAMKKLLAKKIVTKDNVNDNPVYTLASLESITRAIEEDTEDKKEMLKRRFENFEAFVGSLKLEKGRPVIESFEGADGLKRVYCKMLETGRELLVYQPAHGEEEDPDMADFRVEYFRERRRRNVFSRVISHNTPQGRRFQSRDAFEFRKTLLVDLEECPFNFEKLIMGSAVACINHAEKRACIIHYEELAQTERTLFETMWNKKSNPSAQPAAAGQAAASHPAIPLKTRTASQLREFFLSPKNAPVLFFSAALSGGLSYLFYWHNITENFSHALFISGLTFITTFTFLVSIKLAIFNRSLFKESVKIIFERNTFKSIIGCFLLALLSTFILTQYHSSFNKEQIRERVKTIARTGALQFSSKDLNALRNQGDWKKPEWEKVVKALEKIRTENEGIIYAYIFRENKEKIDFVSDSHSLNPFANFDLDQTNDVDANGDGEISPDGGDLLQWPGQNYPDLEIKKTYSLEYPTASTQFHSDQWGNVISGYAPIKDENNQTVAILGIDITFEEWSRINNQNFFPIEIFCLALLSFLLFRLSIKQFN